MTEHLVTYGHAKGPAEMIFRATAVPYSSIVGAGVTLTDETGNPICGLAIVCHSDLARDREFQETLSRRLAGTITRGGLDWPEYGPHAKKDKMR